MERAGAERGRDKATVGALGQMQTPVLLTFGAPVVAYQGARLKSAQPPPTNTHTTTHRAQTVALPHALRYWAAAGSSRGCASRHRSRKEMEAWNACAQKGGVLFCKRGRGWVGGGAGGGGGFFTGQADNVARNACTR